MPESVKWDQTRIGFLVQAIPWQSILARLVVIDGLQSKIPDCLVSGKGIGNRLSAKWIHSDAFQSWVDLDAQNSQRKLQLDRKYASDMGTRRSILSHICLSQSGHWTRAGYLLRLVKGDRKWPFERSFEPQPAVTWDFALFFMMLIAMTSCSCVMNCLNSKIPCSWFAFMSRRGQCTSFKQINDAGYPTNYSRMAGLPVWFSKLPCWVTIPARLIQCLIQWLISDVLCALFWKLRLWKGSKHLLRWVCVMKDPSHEAKEILAECVLSLSSAKPSLRRKKYRMVRREFKILMHEEELKTVI